MRFCIFRIIILSKKKMKEKIIRLIFIICTTQVFSQQVIKNDLKNKNITEFSHKKIKKLLSNHVWGISKRNDNITYGFYFNFLSNKKGVFTTYNQKTNKILNEIKFKLKKINGKLIIFFGQKKTGLKINKLDKTELVINQKKYNYVRYCW